MTAAISLNIYRKPGMMIDNVISGQWRSSGQTHFPAILNALKRALISKSEQLNEIRNVRVGLTISRTSGC